MRNTTLSRLALLGLASLSAVAFAANTVSGEIRFDARFTTSQKGANDASVPDNLERADNLFVSRARLNFKGDVAKNWSYGIRLEVPEMRNQQLNGVDPSSAALFIDEVSALAAVDGAISQAYVSWSAIENINIMMGRIACPDISSDRLYYQPFVGSHPNNMSVGSVVNYAGDHAGFSIDGKAGPIGYSFGFWKQTGFRKLESVVASTTAIGAQSTDITTASLFMSALETSANTPVTTSNFDSKSLRLGYGGRLSFANKMNGTTSYGLGVGYNQAPLNMPIVVATLGADESGSTAAQYAVAGFNNLSNLAIDGSVAFGAFQLNAGYQFQKAKNDTATNQSYNSAGATSTIFQQDGEAVAWWIEGGYLIMGDSYKFNDAQAVIGGVKLRENQAGLEIVARYGQETRRNVLALTNAVGFVDFNQNVANAASSALIQADVVTLNASNRYLLIAVDNGATLPNSANVIAVSDDKAYETKSSGFAVALKYYFTESANATLEYEGRSNEFNRVYANSTDMDSLYSDSVGTLRLQAAYSF